MEKINNDPGITEITEINGDKKNKIKYNERKTLNGENKGSSDGVTESRSYGTELSQKCPLTPSP